jgi:hypothetical protein
MNDVYKYAKKLQATVKLIESIIAGAVAFYYLGCVICEKRHKKKLLLILQTFITI